MYNCLSWHENWVQGKEIKCYHFFNEKPWELVPNKYKDLPIWYKALDLLMKNHPSSNLALVI